MTTYCCAAGMCDRCIEARAYRKTFPDGLWNLMLSFCGVHEEIEYERWAAKRSKAHHDPGDEDRS